MPVPAGSGLVAAGARPPQALQTPMETWMLSRLVLTDHEGIRPGMPSLHQRCLKILQRGSYCCPGPVGWIATDFQPCLPAHCCF